MESINKVLSNMDKTLAKRRQMSDLIEQALKEAPQEMNDLIDVIGRTYYSGNIHRFWDVLAIFAGAERGYGNDWFFSIIELKKEMEDQK